ncbi:MAG: phosphoglucomutase/phosphomannomutase family protein, partial [Acidobacteria bacterium]|nr:phosphoglucomutase/phosphomannomutase family protein [Acidobacteriota bacterium]MCA1608400.1 phosphoglucomutase/phosphomannomutase family protein [Acidobacteriota bacterium]
MSIRFGTSGWRAVIADEFTFNNVERVTKAICGYLKNSKSSGPIVIGNDTRFMGEKFVAIAADVASRSGFKILRCIEPVPTPCMSFAIRSEKALGGINFTASHNPPEYQGIKFSTADGAPALPEVTGEIERLISGEADPGEDSYGNIEDFDPRSGYLEDLRAKIRFDVIAKSGGRYVYDPLWGTGRNYLDAVLRENGNEVLTIHD